MFKTHYNLRCSFVCFVALLQLAVVPATYSLHLDCEHTHSVGQNDGGFFRAVASCFSGHHCDCTHHTSDDSSSSESQSPEAPHDSDSCAVCQTAFATFTADFTAPKLTEVGQVFALTPPAVMVPASAPRYRSKSRGPPPIAPVS